MDKFTFVGVAEEITKINRSVNGNPAYKMILSSGSNIISGRTTPDAMAAYSISANMVGSIFEVTAHITKGGQIYFDYLTRK